MIKIVIEIKICTPAATAGVCHQYKVIYLFRLTRRNLLASEKCLGPGAAAAESKGELSGAGVQGRIGSGVSSLLLTTPRCLLKTPSSPAKARRKSAGLATPKEQGTNATFNTRSLGFI